MFDEPENRNATTPGRGGLVLLDTPEWGLFPPLLKCSILSCKKHHHP